MQPIIVLISIIIGSVQEHPESKICFKKDGIPDMKKLFACLLALVLALSLTVVSVADEAAPVRLAALKGPTAMGLVQLLDSAENGQAANSYDFLLAGSADEITPKLIQGEIDIAAVPINLASVLYNKTSGGVQVIALNALGVLYVVEKGGESIQSLQDLKGKTIYATGKGSTPEYNLTYLLKNAGLDIEKDLTVEWKSEPTEVVALMKAQDQAIAMLPQPYVTVASTQLDNLRVALDLTAEWDKLDNGSRLVTAGIVVRTEYAQQHPKIVAAFLQDYAASAQYVNENVEQAAALIEKYGIVKAAVAQKALPQCNIVCLTGEEMRTAASGYLQVLAELNVKAVGGQLPGEDFYYQNETAQ